ncbi:hypothetical protein [Conchiformibius kuhniae]|uniref:Uncharacterized protein n=1 Tax=Conchiformibius kuhniae TaxID=211502 RepID=A0A8T9MSN7_9NEIS|nr:hypothetical protein [Conchiformibius kuhniae]UOP04094.1 hypothetical protein LVJ77_06340 [Conchiformibius kuhniae]
MLYLKIRTEPAPPDAWWQRLLLRLLPCANPDFEPQIHLVCTWLLAFEAADQAPVREIGLDAAGRVIIKTPDARNYGYWTDNHLTYQDFQKHFPHQIIDCAEFQAHLIGCVIN